MHHNGSVSLIDPIFVTNSALTDFCNIISALGNSDHNGIHLQCSWKLTELDKTVQTILKTVPSGVTIKLTGMVPYTPLMIKLQVIGLYTNLLTWLYDYLTLRKQQVVVDGEASDQVSVVSGIPQGSVLGPLLFSI